MLKQYIVLKTFFYCDLVRYAGSFLWMKPVHSGDYVRKKLIKEYVAPVDQSLMTEDEQAALLAKISVEEDPARGVNHRGKSGRPKRS